VADFDKAIPPGQEGRITLKVDTKNKKGSLKQIATVFSNDPQNPVTKVSTIVSIKQYIEVEPGTRVFLQGSSGEMITRDVTIVSHDDRAVTIKKITSDIDDKIEYKLKTVKEGKEYRLEIKTRSGLSDVFRGKIIVETDSQKKPAIELSVMSKVQQ
jgi:hypothetical protein